MRLRGCVPLRLRRRFRLLLSTLPVCITRDVMVIRSTCSWGWMVLGLLIGAHPPLALRPRLLRALRPIASGVVSRAGIVRLRRRGAHAACCAGFLGEVPCPCRPDWCCPGPRGFPWGRSCLSPPFRPCVGPGLPAVPLQAAQRHLSRLSRGVSGLAAFRCGRLRGAPPGVIPGHAVMSSTNPLLPFQASLAGFVLSKNPGFYFRLFCKSRVLLRRLTAERKPGFCFSIPLEFQPLRSPRPLLCLPGGCRVVPVFPVFRSSWGSAPAIVCRIRHCAGCLAARAGLAALDSPNPSVFAPSEEGFTGSPREGLRF